MIIKKHRFGFAIVHNGKVIVTTDTFAKAWTAVFSVKMEMKEKQS